MAISSIRRGRAVPNMHCLATAFVAAHLLCLFLGCQREPTYRVSGRITMADGTPVGGGQVEFRHVERPLSAIGFVAEDGTFEVTLRRPGDGTVEGEYRLALVPPAHPAGLPGMAAEEAPQVALRAKWLAQVPPRYQSANDSGLTFTVSRGKKNDCHIEISP